MQNHSSKRFPEGFLWGAATAAHQVEGNNVNSDLWVLENVTPTLFAERSGDACDHYNRYAEDIRLLAGLGLNTYRFSIEWARIEPEPGVFDIAELDHYRRMLAACHENHVTPMVTFYHFSSPRWFAAMGGWEQECAGDTFVRYCERATEHFGDLISIAATFNEPNIPMLLRWVNGLDLPLDVAFGMVQQAAHATGSDRFSSFVLGNAEKVRDAMLVTHHRALIALKSGSSEYPVGVTIAMQDEQEVGPESQRDRKRVEVYEPWLAAGAESDFIGVQTYSRSRVGSDGDLPPEPGIELTQMGYEFWPEALEQTIRYAYGQAKVPIYITENGVSTEDDTRRLEYIDRALAGVRNCLDDGIDIRGYIHWSLLDNFEWLEGYRPKFGLVAVNRETQQRTIKPSAHHLGEIARRNGVWSPFSAFNGSR
jgi:beta-glucosidase